MVSEQVYILGRMGSAKQALHLIIEKLGDIPQASTQSGVYSLSKGSLHMHHKCLSSDLASVLADKSAS